MSDAVDLPNLSVQSSELEGDISTNSVHLCVREGRNKSKMDQDQVKCATKKNDDSGIRNLRVTYSETEECSNQLVSDNEGGDVKKVCVAGGHNISKGGMEVKRTVVSPADVEMEGETACSNIKPSVEGANALNGEVLRMVAENVFKGDECWMEKEGTEVEKKTDDKKGVMNVVEECKEEMKKMNNRELEQLILKKLFDKIGYGKERSDVRCRHDGLEEKLDFWLKITTDLQRQLDDINSGGKKSKKHAASATSKKSASISPRPSQQMLLDRCAQRMRSGSTPSAGTRAPAAVSLSAPATSSACGATIATRAAASAVVAARPQALATHPAPLPRTIPGSLHLSNKLPPSKPMLKVSRNTNNNEQVITVSWNMSVTADDEEIASYQLYAYKETTCPPSTSNWKKVGDVKAMPLPMACTWKHVAECYKCYFSVRAVDIKNRCGPFSSPKSIVLPRN